MRRTPCVASLAILLSAASPAAFALGNDAYGAAKEVNALQQAKKVTGVVVDQAGVPVVGANIVVKGGAGVGTITDIDGNFTLDVANDATLIVSYIGYLDQEVSVKGKTSLQITL